MNDLEPEKVLERFRQATINKALPDMLDLYAEEAVHEFPFTRPGVPSRLEGKEQIKTFLEANWKQSPLSYERYRTIAVHHTNDPKTIIIEQEAIGGATTTGRHFALPNIVVLTIKNGKIVRFRDYVNVVAVKEAVGT
jgi:ketosteroid isomerase-like protein